MAFRSRRQKQEFVRQGAKIMPPETPTSQSTWQQWAKPGMLVKLRLDKVLIRDPQNDWEGKQALRPDESRWYLAKDARVLFGHPGLTSNMPSDLAPIVGVYLGELGRRSIDGGKGRPTARVAVHGFLLSGGPYIVHPEAFQPLAEEVEENAEEG